MRNKSMQTNFENQNGIFLLDFRKETGFVESNKRGLFYLIRCYSVSSPSVEGAFSTRPPNQKSSRSANKSLFLPVK